jgi:hypothetical protein
MEIPWFYEENVGSGKLPQREIHSGSHFEMFNNIIIPGLRKLSSTVIASIEPFNFEELVEFSPDFLAGWLALTYDHPLADASLRAREQVIKNVKPNIASLVEPGHPKHNFGTGAGKWSGLTYKLALLPIYIGNYPFQGKRYSLYVNGQTGKVSGDKPLDSLKITMLSIGGFLFLVILAVIIYLLVR